MTYYPGYSPDFEELLEENRYFNSRGKFLEAKGVVVAIPTRNEPDFKRPVKTVRCAMKANLLAKHNGIQEKVIDKVVLCEQSTDPGTVVKTWDGINEEYQKLKDYYHDDKDLMPELEYFRIGPEMCHQVSNDWKDISLFNELLKYVHSEDELKGKGLNMYLSFLALDPNSLLYLDSDLGDRTSRQCVALALPMSHMGYEEVTGTFRRYHRRREEGNTIWERGGRVNAATRALFDMLVTDSLMAQPGYPLSGDQGAVNSVLEKMRWPRDFGIETAWRLQMHSWVNGFNRGKPLMYRKNSTEVNIIGSDDIAIGKGKIIEEVLKGIANMSGQVAESALAVMDYPSLIKRWKNADNFMETFQFKQWASIQTWRRRSEIDYGNGKALAIAGGINEKQLIDSSLEAIEPKVRNAFSSEHHHRNMRQRFLPTPKKVKKFLGKQKYNELRQGLLKFLRPIN